MEEILSQNKAINLDYVTDLTSDSPSTSDSENSNNKENYKTDEPQKKKRKSTEIEDISGLIAAMGESRDRFYEKKLDLEEQRLRAENEKIKLELEMLKFYKNNE
ncbi:hypothetical protein C1645_817308 [Glomus cerebriforme]|uniref:Uncharacterized protein n=1 Tax=Glomus cerebriforme TaxID=658196 RepID=A0A397TC62_9GLOM|nr:hypothetical protein C1645_817308 [Glomus cerebriforme]